MTKTIRGNTRDIVISLYGVIRIKEVVYLGKHYPVGKKFTDFLQIKNDFGLFKVVYENDVLTFEEADEKTEHDFNMYPKIEVGL